MTQERKAFIIASSAWAIFFIFAVLLPPPMPEQEEKIFGEMAIRLEPLIQDTTNESVQREAVNNIQEESSFEEVVTEAQNVESESRVIEQPIIEQSSISQETVAPAVAQQPRRQQALAKSIEELMAEQSSASQATNEVEWSDDIFADSSAVSSNNAQSSNVVNRQSSSSLSGSAANSRSSTSNPVLTQGESGRVGADTGSVSGETSELLSGISSAQSTTRNTQQSTTMSQSASASTSSTQNNTTGYSFSFEGEPRRLLYPANPKLEISPENQSLITATRNVTVTLTVSANGTVSPSTVTFSPSALVPASIQSELRQQIAQWRFEEGVSSGQASFFYSIIVQ